MSFVNKVVLVTGAGSGLGVATAILYAKEKADLVIVDCNEETANKTAKKCKQFGNKVLVIKTDLTKDAEANNAIEKTLNNFGKLNVLVNNAGIVRHETLVSSRIMDTFDKIINTNLRSVVVMTSLASPHLMKTKGCTVNTSSIVTTALALRGNDCPGYTVSKASVDCFTRLSALELAASGVRVNAVNPAPVYTNILSNAGLPDCFDKLKSVTALLKCSDPQEIADLIVYLASDKAKSITGGTYAIDNGLSLI